MITVESEREVEHSYDSVIELAEAGLKNLWQFNEGRLTKGWHGVDSPEEVLKLASEGWLDEAECAMDIAAEAIESVERDSEVSAFRAVWDVTGCEVDVSRYLASQPENMIDYEIAPTVKSSRVIVLCASVCYSSAISVRNIKRRGHSVAALAFALSKLGFATELWADVSVTGGQYAGRIRVQVKGPNDALDPALIMFAYSHPSMLRALSLPAMHEWPKRFHKPLRIGSSYGRPIDPKEDLPEGSIYLPAVSSHKDVPEVQEILLKYLGELGIL
ncbi:hypothetical protein [Lentzea sp. NPDC004782]|uniref:DUF7192 family protein n=1 Tax=Lentzea sp. NPDC004782 TaxID=3154458 RepID=UPI0033A24BE6